MVYTEYRFYGKYFRDLLSDIVWNRCKYVDYRIYYIDIYIQHSHLEGCIYSHSVKQQHSHESKVRSPHDSPIPQIRNQQQTDDSNLKIRTLHYSTRYKLIIKP